MAFRIYNASAGSGKTFGLVRDLLRILFALSHKSDEIDRVLAVTFTNKAANEMKGRLINELDLMAHGKDTPMAQILKESQQLSDDQLRQKAAELLDELLFHYDRLHFSTIDKWTFGLIRTFGRELGISFNANVEIDDETRTREIIENYLNTLAPDDTAFPFLVEWTSRKIEDQANWDITGDLQKLTYFLLPDSYASILESLQNETPEKIPALHEQIQKQLRETEHRLIEALKHLQELLARHQALISYYNNRFNLLEKLITKPHERFSSSTLTASTFRELFLDREKELTKKNKNIPPSDREQIDKLRAEIPGMLRQYLWLTALRKGLRPLVLLEEIVREVQRYKDENDVLFISDFNKIIRRVVKNNPAPFIYWRLGQRLKYHFIDEFQDTSRIQWENFLPLLQEVFSGLFGPADPGSVTLFGDAKQSIYRFRGAVPEQFIRLALPPSEPESANPFPTRKQIVRMDTNYRSLPAVVDFNNAFFAFAGTYLDDFYRSVYTSENLSQKAFRRKESGYVEIRFTDKPGKDEDTDYEQIYLDRIVEQIRDLRRRGYAWKDIAILFPRNKHGALIAARLSDENMPAVSGDALAVGLSSKVQLLVHLLAERRHPSYENRFLLLQYWAAVKGRETDAAFFDATRDLPFGQLMFYLSGKAEAVNVPWSELTLFDFFATAYDFLDLDSSGEDAYVRFFMDMVRQNDRRLSDTVFLHEWEGYLSRKPIPGNETLDAIRLMTVHKAKGLEFPAVIFAFPNYELQSKSRSGRPDYVWVETSGENELPPYIPLEMIDVKRLALLGDEYFEKIYSRETQRSIFDTTNLFYVAFTRARDELYVFPYDIRKPAKDGTLNDFQQILMDFVQNHENYDEENQRFATGTKIRKTGVTEEPVIADESSTHYRHLDWNAGPFLLRTSKAEFSAAREATRHGRLLHTWLARIRDASDVELYRSSLGSHPGILQTLEQIVGHPRLQKYFQPPYRILTERSVGQMREGEMLNRRPDRICLLPQSREAVLIDYKTGRPQSGHESQMREYARLLRDAGYRVSEALLVYAGDDQISVKEVSV